MIMLIGLVGALTKIRMGEDCITFTDMRPRRGQYALIMSQSRFLNSFSTVNYYFGLISFLFS